jgi:hypothetical protein
LINFIEVVAAVVVVVVEPSSVVVERYMRHIELRTELAIERQLLQRQDPEPVVAFVVVVVEERKIVEHIVAKNHHRIVSAGRK